MPLYNMESFAQLFTRYATGQADSQQEADFLEQAALPENREMLEALIENLLRQVPGAAMPAVAEAAILEAIFQAEPARVIPMQRSRRWPRIAVAVAILVGLIMGGYYWYSSNKQGQAITVIPNAANPADVQPGGNRATLTLADGKVIVLDSAVNGTLATQGNTTIHKINNGQLSYSTASGKADAIAYNTLSTPRGGQYQLSLPDGTKVWLNAASSITYPTVFNEQDRTVNITGEAYFEVAKDPAKPFRVKVNDLAVQVLGTHFNVNSYEDEGAVTTTLLEGKVKLTRGKENIFLQPGQQGKGLQQLTIVNGADVNEVMAWKNGLFSFNGASIQAVMRQLSRWYDIEVSYEGTIPTETFSGEIGRGLTLKEVLEGLTETRIHFRIEGRRLVLMP
jgi:transmembrane sensor